MSISSARDLPQQLCFHLAESILSILRENFLNLPALLLLDQLVRILHRHMQPKGKLQSHGSLSASHKADQNHVLSPAVHPVPPRLLSYFLCLISYFRISSYTVPACSADTLVSVHSS